MVNLLGAKGVVRSELDIDISVDSGKDDLGIDDYKKVGVETPSENNTQATNDNRLAGAPSAEGHQQGTHAVP